MDKGGSFKQIIKVQRPLGSYYSNGIKGLIQHAKDIIFKGEQQNKSVTLALSVNPIKNQHKVDVKITDSNEI